MIGQKLRPVSQKMWQFNLNMNIYIILVDDLHTIFLYLLSNWGYIENCEIF